MPAMYIIIRSELSVILSMCCSVVIPVAFMTCKLNLKAGKRPAL